MKHVVLGTAGHIDHGKTTLIKALTGIDTDRLKEEQERGITIDIGFAHLDLPEDTRVGIVDVPGHERFVRNMLAGVGGIDLVLLVVAADEGAMPQTREHLEICSLLGIRRGLVALTKIDMVEPDWLELVEEDLAQELEGSFLEGAPVLRVSGVAGQGLDELEAAIARVVAEVQERPEEGVFRLPVDRVFTIRGFGTVVTGTVVGGRARLGEHVWIQPQGQRTKIRGIEIHDQRVEETAPGRRTALNLQGVERESLERGTVITGSPHLEPASLLDVRLEVLPSAPWPLKHRSTQRLHVWSSECFVQIALAEGREIPPGGSALAQLRLETPVVVLPGDRFVLRLPSPATTLAGGRILGVAREAMRRRDRSWLPDITELESPDPAVAAQAALRRTGLVGLRPAELGLRVPGGDLLPDLPARLVRQERAEEFAEADRLLIEKELLRGVRREILRQVARFHQREPLRLGAPREEIRSRVAPGMEPKVFTRLVEGLCAREELACQGGLLMIPGFEPTLDPEQRRGCDGILAAFQAGAFRPPLPAEVLAQAGPSGSGLYRYLLDTGELVKITESVVFPRDRYEEIRTGLARALEEQGEVDMGIFKELFGLSRKYAVPLLEHFDAAGLTRRVGDKRVLR